MEKNGQWEELDVLFNATKTHLISRLLGVLESEGRSIKPCLIHGDLWDGNVATDTETGEPFIFDAAAYYAHNEMELGIWRAKRHKLREEIYRDAYLRHVQVSRQRNGTTEIACIVSRQI
jgi:protein-ribulosamine 3-kinase